MSWLPKTLSDGALRVSVTIAVAMSTAIQLLTHRRWSAWFDEGFTVFAIHHDWSEMYDRLIPDVHPPLYYFLAKTWASIFGGDIYSIRLLSVVLSVGLALSVFWLCRMLLRNNYLVLAATALACLGPFTLRYSIEARMYIMAALIVSLATSVLYLATKATKTRKHVYFILYAALIAAAFLTQYLTMFVPMAHGLWLLHSNTKSYTISMVWGWITSSLWVRYMFLVLALVAFWLPTAYDQVVAITGGFWIGELNVVRLLSPIFSLFLLEDLNSQPGGPITMFVSAGLAWLIIHSLVGIRKLIKDVPSISLLIFVSAAPFAGLTIMSLVSQPAYYDRYFSNYTWAIYSLIGAGLTYQLIKMSRKLQVVSLAAILIVGSFAGYRLLAFGEFDQDKDLHQAASISNYITENGGRNQVVVVANFWDFLNLYAHDTSGEYYAFDVDSWSQWGSAALINNSPYKVNGPADVPTNSGQTVWLVGIDPNATDLSIPGNWRQVGETVDDYNVSLTRFTAD